jgi:peptidoglycan-N-acetylglucosamine deacetylase
VPLRFPSRAHAAGVAALAGAAVLWPLRAELSAVPLALFVAACLAAPYFPSWSFFLPVILRGPRDRPEVALTFDDGPDPRTTGPLLALLAEHAAPAAFFVVGRCAEAHPEAVRALLAAGHELGNHSHTHDVLLAARSVARLRGEVLGCERALAAHGVRPLAYRPPVGITSPPLRGVLHQLGLRCVAFSCRPLDFGNRRLRDLAARVLSRVRAGDIVLLHDALPAGVPVEAWLPEVRKILEGLKARGLRPVALSALLRAPVMEPAGAAPAPEPERGPGWLARAAQALQAIFLLGYPVLVAVSVTYLGARAAALLLLGVFLAGRLRTLRQDLRKARALTALGASVAALLLLAAVLDDPRFLLAYPSLVNAVLLAQFGWSLRRGPPMAERFARLSVSDLSPAEIRYCRTVTLAWCGFFALNGAATTALALWAPRAWWAAYAGGLSYLLVGLAFAAEYTIRKARFGRFGPGLVDRVLARLLRRAESGP